MNYKKMVLAARNYIFKHWLSLLISLGGAGGIIYYVVRYSSELSSIKQLTFLQGMVLSMIAIAIQVVNAWFTLLLVQFFNTRMSIGSALSLNASSSLVNIIPFGAAGFRALYLKRVYGLRYMNYLLVMFCILFIIYFVGGISGLVGMAINSNQAVAGLPLLLIFIAYIFGSVAVLGFFIFVNHKTRNSKEFITRLKLPKKVKEITVSIMEGFGFLGSHPKTVIALFVAGVLSQVLLSIKMWLIGAWLGYPVSFGGGIILNSLSYAVSALPIPDQTLGLREAVNGLGAVALGISSVKGVIMAGLDRVLTTAWNIIIGIICLVIIRKNVSNLENHADLTSDKER